MSLSAVQPRITVRNAQRKIRVHLPALQMFAERALEQSMQVQLRPGSVFEALEEISAIIVSDARMAALHKRFLNIPGPTDVITFQHGEIVVSAETARRNAATYRTSTENEIRLYIIHGILHLMGFDDTTAVAARTMRRTQKRIFAAASREVRPKPRRRAPV